MRVENATHQSGTSALIAVLYGCFYTEIGWCFKAKQRLPNALLSTAL